METRYIVQHLARYKNCQKFIIIEDFKKQFTQYKSVRNQRERKSASRARLSELDYEKAKKEERERKAASRSKLKEIDYEKAKKEERDRKALSRARLKEVDNDKSKKDQRDWKRLSRRKRKLEDPKAMKDNENAWQQKHRRVENADDRLKEFREGTQYNAIFICTCCHQRMFQTNVCIYTTILENNINSKKPGHTATCIERQIPTRINGEKNCYICKTCLRHMQKGKLPPMSTMNGLK